MSGKSSLEFQWTEDEIQLLLETTRNLKVQEDYKKITRFYHRPTVIYVLVFLHLFFQMCFHQVFGADRQLSHTPHITFRIGALQPLSVTKIMPKKICSNGNRKSNGDENWNGARAIWCDGNIVLSTCKDIQHILRKAISSILWQIVNIT